MSKILPVVTLGAGAVVGYFLGSQGIGGGGRPTISLSRYSIPANQTYNLRCEGFPPNTLLIGIRDSSPSNDVNMGVTDGAGNLQKDGLTAYGPAGQYRITIATANGQYVATVTFNVT